MSTPRPPGYGTSVDDDAPGRTDLNGTTISRATPVFPARAVLAPRIVAVEVVYVDWILSGVIVCVEGAALDGVYRKEAP